MLPFTRVLGAWASSCLRTRTLISLFIFVGNLFLSAPSLSRTSPLLLDQK